MKIPFPLCCEMSKEWKAGVKELGVGGGRGPQVGKSSVTPGRQLLGLFLL